MTCLRYQKKNKQKVPWVEKIRAELTHPNRIWSTILGMCSSALHAMNTNRIAVYVFLMLVVTVFCAVVYTFCLLELGETLLLQLFPYDDIPYGRIDGLAIAIYVLMLNPIFLGIHCILSIAYQV